MIQINATFLRTLKPYPCKPRFEENFLVHYPEFNGTWSEFLELDKISYEDRMWVAQRVLNRNQLIHFAVLCAQSVLSIYENKYPDDKRVSDLINFMTTIVDFSNLSDEQQTKLRELRIAAVCAIYAAYAAYAANAASAAHAAAHAASAAVYAANAVYASYAANAVYASYAANAADADDARKIQQELNISFLKIVEDL